MQKRVYNFEKIRGVDVSSSPLTVSKNRASRMINMINEDGVNVKRHGWRDVARFSSALGGERINGIFAYKDKFVVHAGQALYLCDNEFNIKEKIPGKGNYELKNQPAKGYVSNGRLWIAGAGDYIVYDGETVQRVYDSDYAYIPTTTVNITSGLNGAGYIRDRVNLLCNRRKNMLIGAKRESVDSVPYVLDGMVDFSGNVRVSFEGNVSLEAGENEEAHEGFVSFDGYIEFKYSEGAFVEKTGYVNSCVDDNGMSIEGLGQRLIDKVNCYNQTVHRRSMFSLGFDCLPEIGDTSNITVEFTPLSEDGMKAPQIICSSRVNISRDTDVVCLGAQGGMVYFTDYYEGFGYVPSLNYIGLGQDEDITAVSPFEKTVGVFTRNTLYQLGLSTVEDENGAPVLKVELVSVHHGFGAIGEQGVANVNGDTLVHSQGGVFGVTGSGEKPLAQRSTFVNKAISKHTREERQNSVALAFDGRYHLFVGDTAYIADTRFKTYESQRLDTSFEYEWWMWKMPVATAALEADGKMYIGTADGRIKEYSKGYVDVSSDRLVQGDYTYNSERRTFIFNGELEISERDSIRVTGQECGAELSVISSLYDGEYYLADTDGMVVEFDDILGIELYLVRKANVCCEICTGIIDLYPLYSKSLLKLTLTPTEDTTGIIEMGYSTAKDSQRKERYAGGNFDLLDMSFKSFSFEGQYAKTYVKRAFERNFNYITICFCSKSDGAFGIISACAVYTVGAEIRSDL